MPLIWSIWRSMQQENWRSWRRHLRLHRTLIFLKENGISGIRSWSQGWPDVQNGLNLNPPRIVRLFNPKTRLWSIYWADSNTGVLDPPVIGSFENDIGYFFTKDIFNGKNIIMAFRWDARDKNNPVWSQAYSEDNGKTWEWNWYMYMSKAGM